MTSGTHNRAGEELLELCMMSGSFNNVKKVNRLQNGVINAPAW
jgi:hypothetical protein